MDEWMRIDDGLANPLGKVCSKREGQEMFAAFRDVQFTVADPLWRSFPGQMNAVNQGLFT